MCVSALTATASRRYKERPLLPISLSRLSTIAPYTSVEERSPALVLCKGLVLCNTGLAISCGGIEAHHGTISIGSNSRKGTTVGIFLPAIHGPGAEP